MIPVRVNYLNNRELLSEIHKSKMSFCSCKDKKYYNYDLIVYSLDDITPELIDKAKIKKAAEIRQQKILELKSTKQKVKTTDVIADPDSIEVSDIVWRVMTDTHIPRDESGKKRRRVGDSDKIRTIFPSYQHYILSGDGFVEVARSHWKGDFETGTFSQEHGKVTNRLALMFLTLVDRYSRRSNWRGYSYLDEMRGQALLQLSQVGLQFDEAKSENPFAFYTTTVKNAFTKILNTEKRNQTIRDDILIDSGNSPSYTRQVDDMIEQRMEEATVETPDPSK
jgi:hypothetical protein